MSKFICITGADRGIGLELTRKFLEKKYIVFAGKYFSDGWYGLDELNNEYKENLHIINLDISDSKSVNNALDYIKQETDKLDILINNAGILGKIQNSIFDELDFEEMQKVLNVNSIGTLRMTNALIPLVMKSVTKLIVNISSEAGSIGMSERTGWFEYCMSKAAINMQAAIIHNSIKKLGGQVMLIHPGWVKTYMQGKIDENAALTSQQSAEGILNQIINYKKYFGDKPAYIDFEGKKLSW